MSAQQTNLGIVVGVDGSPCSHTAVEWAARDAQMRNVALRVVQVVPPVITAPEGWAFEYSRFQEAQKREIVEHSYLVGPEGLCDLLGWCPPARKAPSEP